MFKKVIGILMVVVLVCGMSLNVFAIDYYQLYKEWIENGGVISNETNSNDSNPYGIVTITGVEFEDITTPVATDTVSVKFKVNGTIRLPSSGEKWGISHLTLVLIDKNNQNNQTIQEVEWNQIKIEPRSEYLEETNESLYYWYGIVYMEIPANKTNQTKNYTVMVFESADMKYLSSKPFVMEGQKEIEHVWGASGINVAVNGQNIVFPDQTPLLDTSVNRTYVPVRFLAEALGAQVDWDGTHQVVIIKNYGIEGNNTRAFHYLKMGENKLVSLQYNEGFMKPATAATIFYFPEDIKPVLVNDRTMLPFRYVAELLGSQVYYDKNTGTAHCVKRYLADVVPGKHYQAFLNGRITTGNITDAKINDTISYDSYPIVSTVIGEYFADEVNQYRAKYYQGTGKSISALVFDGEIADVNTWACFDHLLHPEYYGRDIKGLGYMHVYSNWLTNGMNFNDTITNVNGTWVQNPKYVIGALKPFYKEYYGYEPNIGYLENGMVPFITIFNYGSKDTDRKEITTLRNDWGFYIKDGATFSILDEAAYRKISKKFIAYMDGSDSHRVTLTNINVNRIGISIVGNYAYSGETIEPLP